VSVVIPTRNRPEFAKRSVATALAQENVDLEVIIVDDASDEPVQIDCADHRLRHIVQPAWQGVSAARNRGIEEGRGEWIAFLDDDDVWAPHKLATQIDLLHRSGADFAYSGAVVVDASGSVRFFISPPEPHRLRGELDWYNALPTGPSNIVVRRELVTQVGGFHSGLSFMADWDMWLRMAAAGTGVRANECLVGYVDHPGSMTMGRDYSFALELEHMMRRHPALFRKSDGTVDTEHMSRLAGYHARLVGRRWTSARFFAGSARRERDPADLARAVLSLIGRGPAQTITTSFAGLRARAETAGGAGARAVVVSTGGSPPEWLGSELRVFSNQVFVSHLSPEGEAS
jgi:glycosyltransferase involved in cell wall biosynthesis